MSILYLLLIPIEFLDNVKNLHAFLGYILHCYCFCKEIGLRDPGGDLKFIFITF